MTDSEEWRPVTEFTAYDVSNLGRVRSNKYAKPRILSTHLNRDGYVKLRFWQDNKPHYRYLHAVVAAAFIGPRPEGLEVRHLDDSKADNRAVNLVYGTRSQNIRDAVWNSTQAQTKKTHCPSGHPYSPENTYLRPKGQKGWRTCRTCQRERQRSARKVA